MPVSRVKRTISLASLIEIQPRFVRLGGIRVNGDGTLVFYFGKKDQLGRFCIVDKRGFSDEDMQKIYRRRVLAQQFAMARHENEEPDKELLDEYRKLGQEIISAINKKPALIEAHGGVFVLNALNGQAPKATLFVTKVNGSFDLKPNPLVKRYLDIGRGEEKRFLVAVLTDKEITLSFRKEGKVEGLSFSILPPEEAVPEAVSEEEERE